MKPLIIAVLLAAASVALPAGVIVNFDQPTLGATPGSAVTFTGILLNTYVVGIYFTSVGLSTSPELTGDVTPFFVNGPTELTSSFYLDRDQMTGSFGLFDIFIPLGTMPGTYSFSNEFTLFGSPTGGDDLLGSAPFTVEVLPTPEPGSWTLGSAGLAALWAWRQVLVRRSLQAS